MCDYSLQAVRSRDAEVGDKLTSGPIETAYGDFRAQSSTKGFHDGGGEVAVCLRPGTELAFDGPIQYYDHQNGFFSSRMATSVSNVARFREINQDAQFKHHDALELTDGTVVLLNDLRPGQTARVLQLPATQKRFQAEGAVSQLEEEMCPL